MKFTFNWLKEFVTFKAPPEKLAELLTMAGLEVESLTPLREPETNQSDWLFEVAVTPNRGDCLGLAGLAREVSVLTGGQTKTAPVGLHGKEPDIAKRISIQIETPRLCPRYSARIVDGVSVAPSPAWVRVRLESCGIRSINNIVDITNYVMLETGQPLHAFDLDRLPARRIVVRTAGGQRKFTALDGVERELEAEDLLICDGEVPVALAGVMGGVDSEVTAETRSVLLESANFEPTAIRRTAKRLALHSEASHRFERGVDPEGTVAALNRAVYLIGKLAGGTPVAGVADRYPRKPRASTLRLRLERVEKLLGVRVEAGQAEKLLKSLGLNARREAKQKRITVVSSARRPDLSRETDLIEEIARLHGYEKIPTTLPPLRSGGKKDYRLAWERRMRSFLAGEGFVEVINLPFTTETLNHSFVGLWEDAPTPVAVMNPLAKENAEMRLSLLPGLIENLRLNLAQKAETFYAYQLGKSFRAGSDDESEERQCLAGVIFGARPRVGLRHGDTATPGFLDCKGLVEGILDLLHVQAPVTWSLETIGILHPGRAAALHLAGRKLGRLGQMHPDVCDEFGLPPFVAFELDFDGLLEYAPRQIAARSLPRFPSVERDFAVVVDRDFPSRQIVDWIKNRGETLIEDVSVFDQYMGPPIPEAKKSLAYKVSYRAEDRTLTDSEVNSLHQTLVEQIGQLFGAQLRS
ncbi:MAG TPA: phenylalanine--tRNA ligase subunit beta [Candidatus Binatia bacterium]|nr:phenylalanine--tRNA ligase subunit beta [Candidatus Binatia bacterium]